MPVFAIPAALKMLPWRWIGVAAATLVTVGVIWWSIDSYGDRRFAAGEDKVQALWDIDKVEWKKKLDRADALYREREAELKARADARAKEAEDHAARANADRDRAIAQLWRERNARPGGDGGPAPAPAVAVDGRAGTCTGGELYANDAAFLERVVAQWELDRGHLRRCVEQYNDAVRTLSK